MSTSTETQAQTVATKSTTATKTANPNMVCKSLLTADTIMDEDIIDRAFHYVSKDDVDQFMIENDIEDNNEGLQMFEKKIRAIIMVPPTSFKKESRIEGKNGDSYIESFMLNFNILSAWNIDNIEDDIDKKNREFHANMSIEKAIYADTKDKTVPTMDTICDVTIQFAKDRNTGELYEYEGVEGQYGLEISKVEPLVSKATKTVSKFASRKSKQASAQGRQQVGQQSADFE